MLIIQVCIQAYSLVKSAYKLQPIRDRRLCEMPFQELAQIRERTNESLHHFVSMLITFRNSYCKTEQYIEHRYGVLGQLHKQPTTIPVTLSIIKLRERNKYLSPTKHEVITVKSKREIHFPEHYEIKKHCYHL